MSALSLVERRIKDAQRALDQAQKDLEELRRTKDLQPDDWMDVPINIPIQVRNSETCDWADRTFCCYLSKANTKFLCFSGEDKTQTNASGIYGWRFARLKSPVYRD